MPHNKSAASCGEYIPKVIQVAMMQCWVATLESKSSILYFVERRLGRSSGRRRHCRATPTEIAPENGCVVSESRTALNREGAGGHFETVTNASLRTSASIPGAHTETEENRDAAHQPCQSPVGTVGDTLGR